MTTAEYLAVQARLNPRLARIAEAVGEGCDNESKLHEQIINECNRRGWYFVHSRMDMPTTNARGTPDFVIAADDGKVFWIEAKGAKTKVTPHQQGMLHWLERLKHRAVIVRSLEEFLKVVNGNQQAGGA
jgi:hypothetical protein